MAIPFKYNRRSLLIRRVSNSMTVGAIAIVVGVFVAAMAPTVIELDTRRMSRLRRLYLKGMAIC